MCDRVLTPREFLLAIRRAGTLTRRTIQESVLCTAGMTAEAATNLSDAEADALYVETLGRIGYEFIRAPAEPDRLFDERQILTFRTRYLHQITPTERGDYPDEETCLGYLGTIRNILVSSGFGSAFHTVLLTNDPRSGILAAYPNADPLSYVKWYYLLRDNHRLPDYPRGCLFYYGRSRFPCLILSPPAAETDDVERTLAMRVIHEITHYYLTFTLFLESDVSLWETILEIAGEPMAVLIMDIIGECFAHADTARFVGADYFQQSPELVDPPEDLPLDPRLDATFGEWRRLKRAAYSRTLRFLNAFPWIAAMRSEGLREEADELRNKLAYPYPGLCVDLLWPSLEIYGAGELREEAVFSIVRCLEGTAGVVSDIHVWFALNEVFSAYMNEWGLW